MGFFSQGEGKNTGYRARALLTQRSPDVCCPGLPAHGIQAAFTTLPRRQHLNPSTASLGVPHKTWLSHPAISNYCNEILSERVKQYFLQFTHLGFLVNNRSGGRSAGVTSEHAGSCCCCCCRRRGKSSRAEDESSKNFCQLRQQGSRNKNN